MYVSLLVIILAKAAGKGPWAILPWMKYFCARCSHFRRLKKSGADQLVAYIKSGGGFDGMDNDAKKRYRARNQYLIQEKILNEEGQPLNAKSGYLYNRLIYSNENEDKKKDTGVGIIPDYNKKEGIVSTQLLIDQIEMDGLLGETMWYMTIDNNANRLVMLSLGMLYAGMCPLATIVIFLYLVIQSKVDETNAYYYQFRNLSSQRVSTHVQTLLLDLIVFTVVILNSIVLYIASPTFLKFLMQRSK